MQSRANGGHISMSKTLAPSPPVPATRSRSVGRPHHQDRLGNRHGLPGADHGTYAYGINDRGQIVGFYLNDSGTFGFQTTNGQRASVPEPVSVFLLGSAFVAGIVLLRRDSLG